MLNLLETIDGIKKRSSKGTKSDSNGAMKTRMKRENSRSKKKIV